MNNFITYILLGLLLTFMFESLIASNLLKDKIKTEIKFGFWERLVSITLWPLLLIIFIYNFIKSYFDL